MQNIETAIIPLIIAITIIISQKEKKGTFENFSEGVIAGLKNIYDLIPTLLGLFIAINFMRISGLLEFITNTIGKLFEAIKIPQELTGLIILKPISGSASIAYASELIAQNGPDTIIGLIISTIMGATETTIYALAIYGGKTKNKISPKLPMIAILGNLLAIVLSIIICRLYFN